MLEQEIKTSLDDIKQKLANDKNDEFNSAKFNDEARSKIWKIFVRGFFIALFGSIIFTIVYNLVMYYWTGNMDMSIKMETMVTLVWSVIWTPLGFVMGYYFKADKD